MIHKSDIFLYSGAALRKLPDCVYIAAHPLLRPYIANYTLTCPVSDFGEMPHDYTITPTASATLCFSVENTRIDSGLRGVNTMATIVGANASRYDWLLLIEIHPAKLYPLVRLPQAELLDMSLPFSDIDSLLDRRIKELMEQHNTIDGLIESLDALFLTYLAQSSLHPPIEVALAALLRCGGQVDSRTLSQACCMSQRQLERLFRQYVGPSVKTFSRILRVNRAMRYMSSFNCSLTTIAVDSGYYDQSHFVRDFKALCGISPTAYLERRSIFYNDTFKI